MIYSKKKQKILLFAILIGVLFVYSINKFIKLKEKIENTISINEMEEKTSVGSNVKIDENLILVNRQNRLYAGNEPETLRKPNVALRTATDTTSLLTDDAAIALEKMFNDAKKDGIELIAISGYRTYEYQSSVYNNKIQRDGKIEADKYVAQPGASEHQTGLAMDVLSSEYSNLDEGFEDTSAFKWLNENMSKYGFILRFPKGKEDITGYEYEPWHVRYVGKEAATNIMNRGITLEEYLNKTSI